LKWCLNKKSWRQPAFLDHREVLSEVPTLRVNMRAIIRKEETKKMVSSLNTNTPDAWRHGVLEQNDDLSSVDKEKAIVRG
jgi:hypothetical protein